MPIRLLGDAFEALQSATTCSDLRSVTHRFSWQLGFDKFIYVLTSTAPTFKPQRFVISGYPQEWMLHYKTQQYFKVDPLVRHAYTSTLPSTWDAEEFHEGETQEFWEQAHAFGLCAGLSFSIHEQPGVVGIFSLSRAGALDLGGQDLAALVGRAQLFAGLLQLRVRRLDLAKVLPDLNTTLTSRELECLKWSAEGKTAWEIGQILSIGERTVVFHMDKVIQKLAASNKTQAIVRAVVLKLIQP